MKFIKYVYFIIFLLTYQIVLATPYHEYEMIPSHTVIQTVSISLTFENTSLVEASNIQISPIAREKDYIKEPYERQESKYGDFSYEYYSSSNELLEKGYFEYPPAWEIQMIRPLTLLKPKKYAEPKPERKEVISILYHPEGNYVNIINNESQIILSIDVSKYKGCIVDGVCSDEERQENCPADCESGVIDDYCDMVSDGICDPDCTENDNDLDCIREREKKKRNVYLVAALLILVIVGVIIYQRKIKKK